MMKLKSVFFFSAAALLSLFMACSNGEDTAGVLTETESGKTASLMVHVEPSAYTLVDFQSEEKAAAASTQLYLIRTIDKRSVVVDSTALDSNDCATIKVPLDSDFSIIAYKSKTVSHHIQTAIVTKAMLEFRDVLTDEGLTEDTVNLSLQSSSTILLFANAIKLSLGDSVCVSGTFACGIYDQAAQDSGFITIEGIPAQTPYETYVDYEQIEVISNGSVTTDSIGWRVFPGETRNATKGIVIESTREISYTLPQIPLLDSLGDKRLDSLIAPFRRAKNNYDDIICAFGSIFGHSFMDPEKRELPYSGIQKSADSVTYWVTLPPLEDSVQITYIEGEISPQNNSPSDRVNRYGNMKPNDSLEGGYWKGDSYIESLFSEDSSIAISFWIQADSADSSKIGSTEEASDIILSATNEGVGLEIGRCTSDKEAACIKIYNGIDTASTDSVNYGKAKILDGQKHHMSLVIHKKHLTIVINGNTIRDTDLKLSPQFYTLQKIITGDYALDNFLLYSFGDYIRKPEDKDWTRLKAWLMAFYELQKQ